MERKRVILIVSCLVVMQFAGYAIYMLNSFTASVVHKYDTTVRQNYIHNTQDIIHPGHVLKTVSDSQIKKDTYSVTLQSLGTSAVNPVLTNMNINVLTESENASFSVQNDTDSPLVQEVYSMMKKQLGLNNTSLKYTIHMKCLDKPKWYHACVKPDCPQLSNNVHERVQSLFSSEKRFLTKAQDDLLRSVAEQIPENDVILLTAASSNHFDEMQAMLHSLHSMIFPEMAKRENFSFVLWDIGLSPKERKLTEKCCRCQVVTFPFEKFPSRMRDLRCYMWKPLVIRMTQLRARKYAVWQDASTRYVSFPGPVYDRGMHYGLQLVRKKFGVSIPHRTLPETFSYFGQEICNFYQYPEIASGFGVYKNDPFVLTAVTSPWARCGFEQDCMCPRHSGKSHRCYFGPCHRFDQSALGIITATLYSSEIYRIVLLDRDMKDFFWFGRETKERNYFNSTGCLSN